MCEERDQWVGIGEGQRVEVIHRRQRRMGDRILNEMRYESEVRCIHDMRRVGGYECSK